MKSFTKKQVAKKLGISTRTLEKRVNNKLFPQADGERQNKHMNGGGTKLKTWSKELVDKHIPKPTIKRKNLKGYDFVNSVLNRSQGRQPV